MAATLDTHESVFLMFQKQYTDDNGAGGLANSTGNQYVPAFLRSWEVKATGSPPVPRIVIELVDDHDQSPYAADSPSVRARMHVITPRDPGGAREQAILTRARTVYKGVAVSTAQGGFNGGRFNWRRTFRAPVADGNLNHVVVDFTFKMTA